MVSFALRIKSALYTVVLKISPIPFSGISYQTPLATTQRCPPFLCCMPSSGHPPGTGLVVLSALGTVSGKFMGSSRSPPSLLIILLFCISFSAQHCQKYFKYSLFCVFLFPLEHYSMRQDILLFLYFSLLSVS